MALAAPEAVRILDASGHDLVIVETVGVGQAEVDVAAADRHDAVVVSPGWGDAVQVAKAGILEIADVFVVNKADREGADVAVRDLEQMIHAGAELPWTPPVLKTAAADASGIEELWGAISSHRAYLEETEALSANRRTRLLKEVETLAAEAIRGRARATLSANPALADDLLERRIDPYRAAAVVIERLGGLG